MLISSKGRLLLTFYYVYVHTILLYVLFEISSIFGYMYVSATEQSPKNFSKKFVTKSIHRIVF